jgi:hypothetical protein
MRSAPDGGSEREGIVAQVGSKVPVGEARAQRRLPLLVPVGEHDAVDPRRLALLDPELPIGALVAQEDAIAARG